MARNGIMSLGLDPSLAIKYGKVSPIQSYMPNGLNALRAGMAMAPHGRDQMKDLQAMAQIQELKSRAAKEDRYMKDAKNKAEKDFDVQWMGRIQNQLDYYRKQKEDLMKKDEFVNAKNHNHQKVLDEINNLDEHMKSYETASQKLFKKHTGENFTFEDKGSPAQGEPMDDYAVAYSGDKIVGENFNPNAVPKGTSSGYSVGPEGGMGTEKTSTAYMSKEKELLDRPEGATKVLFTANPRMKRVFESLTPKEKADVKRFIVDPETKRLANLKGVGVEDMALMRFQGNAPSGSDITQMNFEKGLLKSIGIE
jgi:hypothetical protein